MKATIMMTCRRGDTVGVTEFVVADLHFWPLRIGMRTGDKFFGEPTHIQVGWEDGSSYMWMPVLPPESLWDRFKRWLAG